MGPRVPRCSNQCCPKKGRREDQTCEVKAAPCGSKLFAMTIRQLRLIEQVWGWVPRDWYVDGVNQLLAASGMLMVRDQFLAASMQHFSLHKGKVSEKHANLKLLGNLLPEGDLGNLACLMDTTWLRPRPCNLLPEEHV